MNEQNVDVNNVRETLLCYGLRNERLFFSFLGIFTRLSGLHDSNAMATAFVHCCIFAHHCTGAAKIWAARLEYTV